MEVKVGLVQLACDASESPADRINRGLALTEQTAREADLVMLPEIWPTGAFDVRLSIAQAEPLNCPLVGELSEIAQRTSAWIHGGSFMEVDPHGSFHNMSVVLAPDGSIAATYRKIHLFGFDTDSSEASLVSGGDDVVVVETPLGTTGLATCYDLRFPELFRQLVDKGATSILVTSGWPTARIGHWNTLAQARAIENQVWLVGCNETGTHADIELGGNSIVVDPWGEVVAHADATETVLFAEIDPAYPGKVRTSFPVLRDRKL